MNLSSNWLFFIGWLLASLIVARVLYSKNEK